MPPKKALPRSRFRYRRYGVYDLTYEDHTSPSLTLRIYSLSDRFRAIREKIPYVRRHLADTIELAPAEFIAYMVTTIWRGIYLAINLYWLSVLFDKVCRPCRSHKERFLHPLQLGDSSINGELFPEMYRSLATSWVSCAMINIAAGRIQ